MRAVVRRLASAPVLCGVLLAAVACSGDPTPTGSGSTGAAESATEDEMSAPAKRVTAPPAIQTAAADLAGFSCRQGRDGSWSASGDITNTGKEPMIYTLTVVTVRGVDKVVGERVSELTVEADETVSFDWGKFARGDAEVCMPHLKREPT